MAEKISLPYRFGGLMKRIIFNLFIIILSFSALFSCSAKKRNLSEFKISLEGNPTTGYTWEHNEVPEGIITIKEKTTYLGDSGVLGAPSRFDYTLKAKKDGKTKLTFLYKRPWESKEPAEKIIYDIEVKNKNIYVQSNFAGVWQLKIFSENDVYQSICDVELNLEERDRTYFSHGSAGVNIFNGEIKIDGNIGIPSDKFALTRMMGPKEVMEFERIYVTLFSGELTVSTANRNGTDMLIIENPAKGLKAAYSRKITDKKMLHGILPAED